MPAGCSYGPLSLRTLLERVVCYVLDKRVSEMSLWILRLRTEYHLGYISVFSKFFLDFFWRGRGR